MKTNQLLKSSLTHLSLGLLAFGALLATALSANASVVNFALGADDYGTLTIGGGYSMHLQQYLCRRRVQFIIRYATRRLV